MLCDAAPEQRLQTVAALGGSAVVHTRRLIQLVCIAGSRRTDTQLWADPISAVQEATCEEGSPTTPLHPAPPQCP